MKNLKNSIIFFLFAAIIALAGCKKDDPVFELVSLKAGDIDLAGVTTATNVPEDAVITAIFSSEVDPASVTAGNFQIKIVADASDAVYMVTGQGSTVTITPTTKWPGGTQFNIDLKPAIKGANGVLFAGNTLTFQTSGIMVPKRDKMVLHLSFDDQAATDETGIHTVTTVGTMAYGVDRKNRQNAAAYFSGLGNLVQVAHAADLISPSITISFWMNTAVADYEGLTDNDPPQSRFVMGLGAELGYFLEIGRRSPDPVAPGYPKFYLKYSSDHVNAGNNAVTVPKATAWTEVNDNAIENYDPLTKGSGWTYVINDLEGSSDYLRTAVTNKWIQVVMTHDAAARTKTIYINGVKQVTFQWNTSGYDWLFTDLSLKTMANDGVTPIAGLEKSLTLGSAASSTSTSTGWANYQTMLAAVPKAKKFFKGSLDEFRIFSIPLTEADVLTLYNNEK
jgi:hypothetical protein